MCRSRLGRAHPRGSCDCQGDSKKQVAVAGVAQAREGAGIRFVRGEQLCPFPQQDYVHARQLPARRAETSGPSANCFRTPCPLLLHHSSQTSPAPSPAGPHSLRPRPRRAKQREAPTKRPGTVFPLPEPPKPWIVNSLAAWGTQRRLLSLQPPKHSKRNPGFGLSELWPGQAKRQSIIMHANEPAKWGPQHPTPLGPRAAFRHGKFNKKPGLLLSGGFPYPALQHRTNTAAAPRLH